MTTGNKILLGVLGAMAAGVVIGLLVAPEKGSDMRKKIRKTAGDWADGLNKLWSQGKEAVEDLQEEARHAKSNANAEDMAGRTRKSMG